MKINEIITEGFWDNFAYGIGQTQLGDLISGKQEPTDDGEEGNNTKDEGPGELVPGNPLPTINKTNPSLPIVMNYGASKRCYQLQSLGVSGGVKWVEFQPDGRTPTHREWLGTDAKVTSLNKWYNEQPK